MREPVRVVDQPSSASHRASESAPRWRCTTREARPSGVSRSSHVASRSCSAALPIRTGGFDQMPAKRTSAGTSSGAAARTLDAGGDGVGGAQLEGPPVHVHRPHASRPATGGRGRPRWARTRSRGRAGRPPPAGRGPSSRSSLVPGSTASRANTPRSVVRVTLRSGSTSGTVPRSRGHARAPRRSSGHRARPIACPVMAPHEIRLVGDPVLRHAMPRGDRDRRGARPPGRRHDHHHVRGARRGPGRQPGRRAEAAVRLRHPGRHRPQGGRSTRCSPSSGASGSTRRGACRCPASPGRSSGPRRCTSPASTSTATSCRSRPTSCWPGCSSTRPTTSTACSCSSGSTRSSSATQAGAAGAPAGERHGDRARAPAAAAAARPLSVPPRWSTSARPRWRSPRCGRWSRPGSTSPSWSAEPTGAAGRGSATSPSPVKAAALELGPRR